MDEYRGEWLVVSRAIHVKALLRIAVVRNIPIACNRAPADFMISSPLMWDAYERLPANYEAHVQRMIGNE